MTPVGFDTSDKFENHCDNATSKNFDFVKFVFSLTAKVFMTTILLKRVQNSLAKRSWKTNE